MFRIPSLLVIPAAAAKTPHDVVLAFAEARGPNHQAACDSCNTRIAMLRSEDGGKTFGALQELTHADPTATSKDWTVSLNALPPLFSGFLQLAPRRRERPADERAKSSGG